MLIDSGGIVQRGMAIRSHQFAALIVVDFSLLRNWKQAVRVHQKVVKIRWVQGKRGKPDKVHSGEGPRIRGRNGHAFDSPFYILGSVDQVRGIPVQGPQG